MRKSVDLQSLIDVLKRNIVWILVVSALLGIIAAVYATNFVTPVYTSSIEVFVNNKSSVKTEDISITNSDITSSQGLTSTYIVFLKNSAVLDMVEEEMADLYPSMQLSSKKIKGLLSFEQVDESMWIKITAKSSNPKYSRDLCESVAKNGMKVIKETTGVDNVKVVGSATLATKPTSPNILIYTLLGIVIGFIGTYVIFYLIAYFDNTVKDKETIEALGLAYFGEIPDFRNSRKRSKEYGYNKNYGSYGYM